MELLRVCLVWQKEPGAQEKKDRATNSSAPVFVVLNFSNFVCAYFRHVSPSSRSVKRKLIAGTPGSRKALSFGI
jgi:hypothetical protein